MPHVCLQVHTLLEVQMTCEEGDQIVEAANELHSANLGRHAPILAV